MKIQHKINHENRKLKKFEYESHQICNTCSKNLPIVKFNKRCKDSREREKQCKDCGNAARDPEQRKRLRNLVIRKMRTRDQKTKPRKIQKQNEMQLMQQF